MQNTKSLPADQPGSGNQSPGDASLEGTPGKIVKLSLFGIRTFLRLFSILKGVKVSPKNKKKTSDS